MQKRGPPWHARVAWPSGDAHRAIVLRETCWPGEQLSSLCHGDEHIDKSDCGKPNLASLPVYGAAYRIPPQHVVEVSAYLDIREINGYSIRYTDFYSMDASPNPPLPTRNCLVYIGLPTNPQFLGLQDPRDVAMVIGTNRGPSGENDEYLFMLEEALDGLGEGSRDEHVKDLADRVRALQTAVSRERAGATITDGETVDEVESVISRT